MTDQYTFRNPVTAYEKISPPKQHQPEPCLAQQLAPKGIRVNAVAPGPIWTPLQVSSGQPKEKLPEFGQSTPLGRASQPAELAPAHVFLASAESSFVVGETLNANGGTPSPWLGESNLVRVSKQQRIGGGIRLAVKELSQHRRENCFPRSRAQEQRHGGMQLPGIDAAENIGSGAA
jgi:hypothetical protein